MNTIETSFEQLTRWLQSTRYLSAEQAEQLLNADSAATEPQTETGVERAWYVKLFIGLSAWIAALFLIAGVSTFALIIMESGLVMTIVGAAILGGALVLKRAQPRSTFWGQFAFALSLTGQAFFFGGVFQILDDFLPQLEQGAASLLALIVIATQILLLFTFPNTVHRLLSVIFASLAGIVLIVNELVDQTLPDDQIDELLRTFPSFLLLVFALGIFCVWQNRTNFFVSRWSELHSPLGYGFAMVVFVVAIVSLFFDGLTGGKATLLWLSSIGIALLLAHLGTEIVDEFATEFTQPRLIKIGIVVALGLLLIPLYNTPSVWVALLALVLGFRHNQRVLQGMASLFLLGFISFYYYSLDITLLNKSYALIGSGVLLLLTRFAGGRLFGQRSVTPQSRGEIPA